MKNNKSLGFLNTPTGLVAVLGALVAGVELLIMLVLEDLFVPAVFSESEWGYVDTSLLTLVAAPALYFLVFRKMQKDITEHSRSQQALQESVAHTQAILDNTVDGMIAINGQGIVESFNRAAERIFGYAQSEVIGQNVKMLMPEPYQAEHDGYLDNYRSSGVPRIIGIGREVRGRRKDGSTFPLDLAVSQVTHEGRPLFIGLTRDITVRKQAEDALVAAKEKAERASQAKSQFLASMSHELRTPMNAVLGFAELMQLDPTLSVEQKEYIDGIFQGGLHLLELVDKVLHLAKIESGTLKLDTEPVSVAAIVNDCLGLIRPLADARGIKVESADYPNLTVIADRLRLKQVLLNLLSNAIKYNRPHGHIRVHAFSSSGGRLARIMVCDTGLGIPLERMNELFEPFSRLGFEGGTIQGTGVGLTISRQLMALMGGSINAESTFGVGSTFWIELPRQTG